MQEHRIRLHVHCNAEPGMYLGTVDLVRPSSSAMFGNSLAEGTWPKTRGYQETWYQVGQTLLFYFELLFITLLMLRQK